ncbi:energy transducer TonB [Mucilaginibacter sp. ZT4R22]|uniref:Energy transducer TonB n=1 Tax=Mucilaginibacter pankratovii TaxID=2772110 RepID=A0ABR7WUF1_9SPHI|nr:energy transducer TonB [Mucilaginibacter pankratovii]MBD1365823.1 energy transducer TonB [Mucilaginibacter pankratovii]
MRNVLMFKGTFLDEELTVPHGKASYYKLAVNQRQVSEHQSAMDTTLQVYRTGYYLNGKKEGNWVEYFLNGNMQMIRSFVADTLDGPYKEFDFSGRLFRQGNYLKGDREGDWYLYYTDSTVQVCTRFRKNRFIDMTEYSREDLMHGAYPNFNFSRYILKSLKNLGLPPITGNVIVAFTITEDGTLNDPKLEVGVNPILDKAIIDAISKSPKWVSARKKKVPVSQTSSFVFSYRNVKEDE